MKQGTNPIKSFYCIEANLRLETLMKGSKMNSEKRICPNFLAVILPEG